MTATTVVERVQRLRGTYLRAEDQAFAAESEGNVIDVRAFDFLGLVFPNLVAGITLRFKVDNIRAMTNEQILQGANVTVTVAGSAIVDVRGIAFLRPSLANNDTGTIRFYVEG